MRHVTIFFLFAFLTTSYAVADENYTCNGGTGDVGFSINAKQEIYITNSECGVRMELVQKSRNTYRFKGVVAEDSDLTLCGNSAILSIGVLARANQVDLKLNGGESAGQYNCMLEP